MYKSRNASCYKLLSYIESFTLSFFDVCTFASLLKFSISKDVKIVSKLFDQVRMQRKSAEKEKDEEKSEL